jgi:hypothetical protein
MEFAIVTLLTIIGLGIGYLAYQSQQRQSFKRLHYTSFIMPLILPRSDEAKESISVRQGSYNFVYPVLCAARIENTGRAPILPSDFNGPFTIRVKGPAGFRCGEVISNRPDILDMRHPAAIDVSIERSEISIGPTLLNPRDSIAVIYVADAAPKEWELEVGGRIAGIEEIVRLPKPHEGSIISHHKIRPLLQAPDTPLGSSPTPRDLSLLIMVWPVLASPGKMFADQLQVFVDRNVVPDAHLLFVTLDNQGPPFMQTNAELGIIVKMPESSVVKLLSVTVQGADGNEQNSSAVPDDILRGFRLGSNTIQIYPPSLPFGWGLVAIFIVSGDCANLTAESLGINLGAAEIWRMETDNLIEANLAQAKPRILLTNRVLYRLWHSLKNRYPPWLKFVLAEARADFKSALAEVRAFLGID